MGFSLFPLSAKLVQAISPTPILYKNYFLSIFEHKNLPNLKSIVGFCSYKENSKEVLKTKRDGKKLGIWLLALPLALGCLFMIRSQSYTLAVKRERQWRTRFCWPRFPSGPEADSCPRLDFSSVLGCIHFMTKKKGCIHFFCPPW